MSDHKIKEWTMREASEYIDSLESYIVIGTIVAKCPCDFCPGHVAKSRTKKTILAKSAEQAAVEALLLIRVDKLGLFNDVEWSDDLTVYRLVPTLEIGNEDNGKSNT